MSLSGVMATGGRSPLHGCRAAQDPRAPISEQSWGYPQLPAQLSAGLQKERRTGKFPIMHQIQPRLADLKS